MKKVMLRYIPLITLAAFMTLASCDDDSGNSGNSGNNAGNNTAGMCGNGVIDGTEQCDGTDFGGLSCQDLGDFSGGTLSCTGECQISTGQCQTADPTPTEFCGNGVIDGTEQCDGTDFGGLSCQDLGDFSGGSLSCLQNCTISTEACEPVENLCGNGVLDQGELCDGTAFGDFSGDCDATCTQPYMAEQFGSSSGDLGYRITSDSDGNLYVLVATLGDLDGAGLGSTDWTVRSYGPDGVLRWGTHGGTAARDVPKGIFAANGRVYVAWYYGDTSKIAYLDAETGSIITTTELSADGGDVHVLGVTADASGYVYVFGDTNTSLFENHTSGTDTWDSFYAVFDADGNLIYGSQATEIREHIETMIPGPPGMIYYGMTFPDPRGGMPELGGSTFDGSELNISWYVEITEFYDSHEVRAISLLNGDTIILASEVEGEDGTRKTFLAGVDVPTASVLWSREITTAGGGEAIPLGLSPNEPVLMGYSYGDMESETTDSLERLFVLRFDPATGDTVSIHQYPVDSAYTPRRAANWTDSRAVFCGSANGVAANPYETPYGSYDVILFMVSDE